MEFFNKSKDYERLEFSKSQKGSDGRYFIACRKENEDVYSQLSKGKLQTIDGTTLEMILSEADASFVEDCEEHFLAKCKDNKEKWFPGSEGLTDQYLESAFMSSLKGVKKMKGMQQMKLKISKNIEVFDSSKEKKEVEDIVEGAKISLIVHMAGLWFTKTRFGVTWLIRQAKIHEKEKVANVGVSMFQEDDEEEVDENVFPDI